jgi:ubiquinone/menaquinone biosynthesis C-methylase UbiE
METKPEAHFTCPWWLLFTFDNPLRKWIHEPIRILSPYVHAGETVLDVGCGMGYFTLGLANLVGANGKVIAADLQQQMLAGLQKRAKKAHLESRIQAQLSQPEKIGANELVDFALAFWMVHEVGRPREFLQEIFGLVKPGGSFLLVEPLIHVSGKHFGRTLSLCKEIGFVPIEWPRVAASRAVYFKKA